MFAGPKTQTKKKYRFKKNNDSLSQIHANSPNLLHERDRILSYLFSNVNTNSGCCSPYYSHGLRKQKSIIIRVYFGEIAINACKREKIYGRVLRVATKTEMFETQTRVTSFDILVHLVIVKRERSTIAVIRKRRKKQTPEGKVGFYCRKSSMTNISGSSCTGPRTECRAVVCATKLTNSRRTSSEDRVPGRDGQNSDSGRHARIRHNNVNGVSESACIVSDLG